MGLYEKNTEYHEGEFLYRYITIKRSDFSYVYADLRLEAYRVIRKTPKGFWIKPDFKEKWVSNDCRKRYAYPTKEEALVNYIKRTIRREGFLSNDLAAVKSGLKQAEELLENGTVKEKENMS